MEDKSERHYSPQKLPIFFAHCFMFLVILVVTLITMLSLFVRKTNFGPIISSNETLDFSTIPDYFVQFSDIHLTHVNPERTKHVITLFKYTKQVINPELLIFTGDIADASVTGSFFEIRKQDKRSWDTYLDVLSKSGLDQDCDIIDIPGNHDLYNIESEQSSSNYFPKYAHYQVTSMNVQSIVIKNKYNFIAVNPVSFPYISAPLGMMPFTPTDILDEMEKQLKDKKNYTNIIISHYPHFSTWTAHPNRMRDIYSKAQFFLCGHTHPSNAQIMHYGEVISVVTSPGSYSNNFGLVTIEKGAIIYHQITVNVDDDPEFNDYLAVTYPIPLQQLSRDQVFNKNQFPVRALGFSSKDLNLKLYIDDQLVGNMNLINRVKSNVGLYSYDVDVPDGQHKLKIEGDLTKEFEFFVGSKSPTIKESSNSVFTPYFFMGGVGALSFLILIRLIPFWLLCKEKLTEFEDFMFYGEGDIKWYHQMYLGPLYMICRLRKVPKSIYFTLIFMFVWYIPLPFYFTKIESKLATLWCWGYMSENTLFKFNTPLWFLLFYYLMVLLPLIDISGLAFEHTPLMVIHKVEFVLFCICIGIVFIAWILITTVAGGAFTVFTSFMLYFVVFAIVFIFCKIFIRPKIAVSSAAEPSY
ncbi:hypothetical protein TRFO_36058 [Tritrichomonas foetus]|uniref:Calcineurin-like phosphoesterase domain-containing protein n=1 Tax=Tritrichomonas foetus TaxID=1144522 RepID=A0A1J4JEX4_9EUKA|nr:hypothetical protein TRFO_36058 [Tritrichomonas foetus]|eukprot:OHS97690.1 hypothetical protein TRFO_36058 [Tritrichomonas foetus]